MRVAYVHDWLVTYRGGEKVLEALLELYPEAPVYTLFYDAKEMPESIRKRDVRYPSALNFFKSFRKILLPILPAAIESLPLEDYDLIISTSSCVAKGVMTGPDALHLCYIHSPMRYIWDQRQHYLVPKRDFSTKEFLIHILSRGLRTWDVTSNNRVDRFLANSSFVAKRVAKYYRREAEVLHPPVEITRFKSSAKGPRSDYFLVAGAFVAYKNFAMAIRVCERLGRRLVVAGSGPDEKNLRALAKNHTEFKIAPNKDEWVKLFQNAQAFLFPGVEDFGITAIEALASGTPVIAFRAGGALDFVKEGQTGRFFDSEEELEAILAAFRTEDFASATLETFAEEFTKAKFQQKILAHIKDMQGTKR